MIDTLRLSGHNLYFKFPFDYERYQVIKKKGGQIVVPVFQALDHRVNGVSQYRVHYAPSTGMVSVEFNPHKLIFTDNIYNYEKDPLVLGRFISTCANYFFAGGDCYVSRCDIGGVSVFDSPFVAAQTLESYRSTRPEGARVNKFKHQNYATSVFYSSKNWSVKVYNKGTEMKLPSGLDTVSGMPMLSTLRFEKTFRFNEMKRLGMTVKPYYGVHLNDFSIGILLDNFFEVFTKWDFQKTPYMTDVKGSIGLLSVLDNMGQLSEVESVGIVSRSTMFRYKKKKKLRADFVPTLSFEKNLPVDLQNKWFLACTFGLNSVL